ncbi:MAG: ribosomal RNA small subunit methyltransferase A [Dehalococcoidia bacterium]|nr:ribosomal RNA small subunit methyltransferase A [Dehalococcoidia bacterium]
MTDSMTLTQLRELLHRHHMRATKRLGQNFLIDHNILKLVAGAATLSKDDTVVEVGPGTGLLTHLLAEQAAEVITVEIDPRMVEILQETLHDDDNVTVVQSDILKIDPGRILSEYGQMPDRVGYKVVANLPYYITSPVLRHFLTAQAKPDVMVVMVQKEVGQAIMAQPGDMSFLSVSVQLFARPSIVRKVPASCFYPPPRVDSLILKLDMNRTLPVDPNATSRFLDFVAAGFHSPRKQLRNTFQHGLDKTKEHVNELLQKSGIDPTRRPETLSVEEWAHLWETHCDLMEAHDC